LNEAGQEIGKLRPRRFIRNKMCFGRRNMALSRQTAGTCGLLQLRARRIDKVEHGLKISPWLSKRVTGDHNPEQQCLSPMIKSELNLGSLFEKPFG